MTAEVGTSRRSDARDNRARIVLAARTAFAAGGADVPIREIARRAEVGVATLYRHFPSKEALLTAAFAEQTELCSAVVAEGLAAPDPWRGFRLVIERLLEAHARDREFRSYIARLPRTSPLTADRDRALRLLLELVRRAKESGDLRPDIVVEDIALALMASDGIRAESPEMRAAASRRLAALMLDSFRASPASSPLPPAVRLPLTAQVHSGAAAGGRRQRRMPQGAHTEDHGRRPRAGEA
ncbi:TetR/AcrR family transcriptional regulator [Actinomadura geliboluensis]|uniref:TetR/AcrR family transcriptional regulator n=1 Tax=Actinomadura geliboluensis TaxID=882440 RepID=UPI003713E728